MKKFIAILSLLVVFTASSAFAIDLNTARKAGAVGEKPDGYIGAVDSSPSGEIATLVSEVNAKRKAAYQDISKGNGQPVDIVEKLAAQKLISNLGSGDYFQDASGSWVRK